MRARPNPLLLVVAFLGFVSLGLPDGVLGIAWPSICRAFDIPISRLGALLAGGTVGYLVSSFSSGALVERLGVGRLLMLSSMLVAGSLAGYATAPAWWLLPVLAVGGGLGAGAIDAGINAYAAARFSPRLVTWLHASYGVGAAAGPLVMTAALMHGNSWRLGYAVIAAALAAMALCFWKTLTLWAMRPAGAGTGAGLPASPPATLGRTLRIPAVWLNVALFFVYTGLEVTVGLWSYSLLTMGRGVDMARAGAAVSIYWGALTGGRVILGFLAGRVATTTLLHAAAVASILAAGMLWSVPSAALSMLALGLLGFSFAPVFPLLIADTPRRVGPAFAHHAIGFQVAAAYLGTAVLPGLTGVAARILGFEAISAVVLALAGCLLLMHLGARLRPRRLPVEQLAIE